MDNRAETIDTHGGLVESLFMASYTVYWVYNAMNLFDPAASANWLIYAPRGWL